MPGFLGQWELLALVLVVLLLFGTKRLPAIGRMAGREIRDFKQAITFSSEPDRPSARPEEPREPRD
jgi:sec-independent protein translocase protein TatA